MQSTAIAHSAPAYHCRRACTIAPIASCSGRGATGVTRPCNAAATARRPPSACCASEPAPLLSKPSCSEIARHLRRKSSLCTPCRASLEGGVSAASVDDRWQRARTGLIRLFPFLKYWAIIQRALVTVLLLAIVRMGHFIPLPALDMQRLPAVNLALSEGERMIKALYGQAQDLPASMFDLGISPYINASIIMSVFISLPAYWLPYPWFDRLREARKEGKAGEAFIRHRVNLMALAFAVYTGLVKAYELLPYALYSKWFVPQTAVALVAGSFIISHCAETISAAGIGSGATLIICSSIITAYAETLHQVLSGWESSTLVLWKIGTVLLGYLGLVLFSVYLATSELRLPVIQYSTTPKPKPNDQKAGQSLFVQARALLDRKAMEGGAQGSHFPVLLNSSGIMPMIIAGAFYYGAIPKVIEFFGWRQLLGALQSFQATLPGLLCYGLLVFCMEFIPLGSANPAEVSEYLANLNIGIRGVAPGLHTTQYLGQKFSQAKFWGGLALGGLAVMAQLFDMLCKALTGSTLATTSLIIIVGAVLQTSRQVESLMEGPRLQQRLEEERGIIQSMAALQ